MHICSDVMACLDHYFLSISDSGLLAQTSERAPTMKRGLRSGGASQRRVRRPLPPPTDPNATHGNAAICRRDYANLVAGDRKKKDTDARLQITF
jgi:hypothetical protein